LSEIQFIVENIQISRWDIHPRRALFSPKERQESLEFDSAAEQSKRIPYPPPFRLRTEETLSSEKHFFFLVNLFFTANKIHFLVRDRPIAVLPLPKRDEDTEYRDTDVSAKGRREETE